MMLEHFRILTRVCVFLRAQRTPCARGTGYGMLMAKELCGVMRQLANTEEKKKKIDNGRTDGQAGQRSTRAAGKVD